LDHAEVFLHFRPIYLLFISISSLLLIIVLFQNRDNKMANGFTIMVVAFISLIVSAFLTYQIGVLSDELGIGGDAVSFFMFIAVVILSFLNPIVYFFRSPGDH
jgi:hypothetical protein